MSEPTTKTLDVAGATLRYDVRESESQSTAPILLMIGSPMDASAFTSLATQFRDRTVATYDPRGVARSERADGATGSTPAEHADDLHRLITDHGAGPVDSFASSGGAAGGSRRLRPPDRGPATRVPQPGQPEAFAARLRAVLGEDD